VDAFELIEIALAASDRQRVEVGSVEPVDITAAAVGGLASIVTEVVLNATELSAGSEMVSVTGLIGPEGYLIEVEDSGVGLSDQFIAGLNRVLDDPDAESAHPNSLSGVFLIAGLAARHGIKVRMFHAEPGVLTRISIPSRLMEEPVSEVSDQAPVADSSEGPAIHEATVWSGDPGTRTEAERLETEAFLEKVFAPLRDGHVADARDMTVVSEVPPPRPVSPPVARERVVPPEPPSQTSAPVESVQPAGLQPRVPGEHYRESSHDPSATRASEAAVEIKLALAEYEKGRREASEG
jgi:hypothetical protein